MKTKHEFTLSLVFDAPVTKQFAHEVAKEMQEYGRAHYRNDYAHYVGGNSDIEPNPDLNRATVKK